MWAHHGAKLGQAVAVHERALSPSLRFFFSSLYKAIVIRAGDGDGHLLCG